MIVRRDVQGRVEREERPAWEAFVQHQSAATPLTGYVSQPAHAVLAGRLAECLKPEVFGLLHADVIDAIGRHDAGWAQSDLAALECAAKINPPSFLGYPPMEAVKAWSRCIRQAEERSVLAGILTGHHFCLLAPRDGDRNHEEFIEREKRSIRSKEKTSGIAAKELGRSIAALGFCDLLSLCLCSGITGELSFPLAHAADPASAQAEHVIAQFGDEALRTGRALFCEGRTVYVDGWLQQGREITSHRWEWKITSV